MDLDLNCAPPSPEPAPQDHRLGHAMLRQEHAYRHQVEELHRLYWAQRNLRPDVPFWEQSHDVLYPTHSMPMATSSQSDMLRGKQAIWCGNGVAGKLGVEGSVRRKPDHGGVHGRSGYRHMIDLEKPATSEDDDDDVEILSPARFSDYAKRNAGFADNSQCYPRENAAHVHFGCSYVLWVQTCVLQGCIVNNVHTMPLYCRLNFSPFFLYIPNLLSFIVKEQDGRKILCNTYVIVCYASSSFYSIAFTYSCNLCLQA
ncbi:uncharacterized protein LOC125544219 isoform X2 [Triticum urartu]|uniref:uncharacterized protein LOC125544219 isoform X2 n=1 Tax=Triticum urartu TaxID=4572 RepID=UPI0020442565|nr:uncharacterized protein LOC125544219 isoform X2 [Triticum urartu]